MIPCGLPAIEMPLAYSAERVEPVSFVKDDRARSRFRRGACFFPIDGFRTCSTSLSPLAFALAADYRPFRFYIVAAISDWRFDKPVVAPALGTWRAPLPFHYRQLAAVFTFRRFAAALCSRVTNFSLYFSHDVAL